MVIKEIITDSFEYCIKMMYTKNHPQRYRMPQYDSVRFRALAFAANNK
ncbi:unnamed protein product [marine sediment metagenome]|uniref:Uncharacterized protein n=1 Tax=marine sediment metagenome TaxID=412755 RepID=X1ACR2_9ZZZZ